MVWPGFSGGVSGGVSGAGGLAGRTSSGALGTHPAKSIAAVAAMVAIKIRCFFIVSSFP